MILRIEVSLVFVFIYKFKWNINIKYIVLSLFLFVGFFICIIITLRRGIVHWVPKGSPSHSDPIPQNLFPFCEGRGGCSSSRAAPPPVRLPSNSHFRPPEPKKPSFCPAGFAFVKWLCILLNICFHCWLCIFSDHSFFAHSPALFLNIFVYHRFSCLWRFPPPKSLHSRGKSESVSTGQLFLRSGDPPHRVFKLTMRFRKDSSGIQVFSVQFCLLWWIFLRTIFFEGFHHYLFVIFAAENLNHMVAKRLFCIIFFESLPHKILPFSGICCYMYLGTLRVGVTAEFGERPTGSATADPLFLGEDNRDTGTDMHEILLTHWWQWKEWVLQLVSFGVIQWSEIYRCLVLNLLPHFLCASLIFPPGRQLLSNKVWSSNTWIIYPLHQICRFLLVFIIVKYSIAFTFPNFDLVFSSPILFSLFCLNTWSSQIHVNNNYNDIWPLHFLSLLPTN